MDLRELYQQLILDHNKSPRNFGKMEACTHHASGDNPLCGDHVEIYLDIKEGRLANIQFEGDGCAISKSSASLMTSALKGKTVEEAQIIFDNFHEMLTKDNYEDDGTLGKLAVMGNVKTFPMRVKCASLAWHTFKQALLSEEKTISTEEHG